MLTWLSYSNMYTSVQQSRPFELRPSTITLLVTLHLTRSFCLPILFYGLEGVNLAKSLAASLEFCWSRVMYKIFNVSDSASAETILFYMGILPISYQIDLCKLRFYHYMYYNHVVMTLCGTLLMQPNDVSLMSYSGLTLSVLQVLCPHITGLCGLRLLFIWYSLAVYFVFYDDILLTFSVFYINVICLSDIYVMSCTRCRSLLLFFL
jgi:hypothetical protein